MCRRFEPAPDHFFYAPRPNLIQIPGVAVLLFPCEFPSGSHFTQLSSAEYSSQV